MRVIDAHTEGEPTRVILCGGPDLGHGSLADRAARFTADHAAFRGYSLCEPRGHDAMVGALLCPASDPDCVTGAIYYNTVGALGMCGHATIGLAVVLAHLGRIGLGTHRIETPVGIVAVTLISGNEAVVENVESYRHAKNVTVEVPGLGAVSGDVAWGGNWFFLSKDAPGPLLPENVAGLTRAATLIREALAAHGVTGAMGAAIDHIEFTGPAMDPGAQGRNFVLCPSGAYDRSPCGTGTSAKLACLAADGLLAPGEIWVQESIIGSRYSASYIVGTQGSIVASIRGRGFVTGDTTLIRSPADPYADGIRPSAA